MISEIFAQITDAAATPTGILMASQLLISGALGIVYRDCRKDRETLWAEVLELKRQKNE